MGLFRRKHKQRCCVIGLDGVPFPLLKELSQQSVMPHMKKLIENGCLHQMKASLPEISSVSWTDFMTGSDAGTHGIFGFTDLKKGTYDLRFPNFHDVKTPTFWDKLAQKNKQSIVINQPSTYPARKINGKLISGFVAIELAKAVYPMTLKSQMENIGYEIDIDTFKCREDHDLLWKELDRTLEGREKALDYFWNEDWDYFELVITGTDRLQHYLWSAFENKDHPYHQNFLDYYFKVDALIGKIASSYQKLTGSQEGLFLLSDHGFTGIEQEVYLNTWLKEEGFLSFTGDDPKDLKEIAPGSKAFAMDPNRIYIHLEGKFPRGQVKKEEKNSVKAEIKEKLTALKYQGKPVVEEIFDTDDVYSGPWRAAGPDLIAVGRHGFDMKGSVKKKTVFGLSNLEGMHTWDEAFFWSTEPHGENLKISNLARIILEYLG